MDLEAIQHEGCAVVLKMTMTGLPDIFIASLSS